MARCLSHPCTHSAHPSLCPPPKWSLTFTRFGPRSHTLSHWCALPGQREWECGASGCHGTGRCPSVPPAGVRWGEGVGRNTWKSGRCGDVSDQGSEPLHGFSVNNIHVQINTCLVTCLVSLLAVLSSASTSTMGVHPTSSTLRLDTQKDVCPHLLPPFFPPCVVLGKFGSVRFRPIFPKPQTGPLVRFRIFPNPKPLVQKGPVRVRGKAEP